MQVTSTAIAKSSGERLVDHGLAVAARYRELANAKAAALSLLPAQVEAAAWLAACHDLGKASRRWQAWANRGFDAAGPGVLHDAGALEWCDQHSDSAALASLLQLLPEDGVAAYEWLAATFLHHGGPRAGDSETALDLDEAEVALLLRSWIGPLPDVRLPADQHVIRLHAGLVQAADWAASGREWPIGARRLVVSAPLPLRPAQVEAAKGGASVVIEAPTGSGKTEAAWLWAKSVGSSGIAIALPTRASASEQHARATQHLGPAGLAVPGLGGDARVALWEAVSVGTADQHLLGVVPTRHHSLRHAGTAGKALVIDEVHTYDPYTGEVVQGLWEQHVGPRCALSATLPEAIRCRLLGRPMLTLAEAEAMPWPCIWRDGALVEVPWLGPTRTTRVERLGAAPTWAEVAKAVAAGARVLVLRSTVSDAIATRDALRRLGLAPVLHHSRWHPADRLHLDRVVLQLLGKQRAPGPGQVVVATQTCEQALDLDADLLVTDACPGAVLLQRLGRLHRHDRSRSPGYDGTPRCLLLDTDPAARLCDWRGAPVPCQTGVPDDGWAWVYSALAVQGCLEELAKLSGTVTLPVDARRLVERSSHPEALASIAARGPDWARAWQAQQGAAIAARQGGELALYDLRRPWSAQTVRPIPVRLGELPVEIAVSGLVSPLTGQPLPEVRLTAGGRAPLLPVPARWLPGLEAEAAASVIGQTILVAGRTLVYGSDGLQNATGTA